MKKKIGLFPGSFDPITKGHVSIIKRALPLFDEIIVGIGVNTEKKSFFPLEQRLNWLNEIFKDYGNIKIDHYTGLTVDFCKQQNANFLIRGLRNEQDFQYELRIAQVNRELNSDIETIFISTSPELSAINSTIIRDIIKHGGDVQAFVPEEIKL